MVKNILMSCLLLSLSFEALSQLQRPKESGFSGDILIGAVYLDKASLMNAGDNNQVLTSFNDKAESDQRLLPGLMGNAYYTFDSLIDQVYVGVSRTKVTEGQFSPEMGYRKLLDGRSSLTLAYIPSLISSDTYSDPFVLNNERDETEQSLSAVRAKWESILNTGLSLELAYGELDIEKEKSGTYLELSQTEKNSLKRSARFGYASVEIQLPITKGIFLSPSIYAVDRVAEGDAYTYQAAGVELGFFAASGRHKLSANVRVANFSYDISNPVFNKQRDDRKYSAFIGYFYKKPFGWKNTTFTVIGNYRNMESNIDFYDINDTTLATGINWNF
jgi:hypothetical protein